MAMNKTAIPTVSVRARERFACIPEASQRWQARSIQRHGGATGFHE